MPTVEIYRLRPSNTSEKFASRTGTNLRRVVSNGIVTKRCKRREAGPRRVSLPIRQERLGVIMFTIAYFNTLLYVHLLLAQAEDAADSFKEMGSLLLWGMLGAVGLAAVVAVILLRLQSRRESMTDYVSINPSRHENQD
jgi:hypothetical protein